MRKVLYIMGQLDDADIAWMAQAGRQRAFAGGEVLIREGLESLSLFIVLEGQVEVAVAGIGHVASLGSGEVLGEVSFVDGAPPSATVTASGAVRALMLDKAQVEGRLARDPGFAGRFYKALAIFLSDRLRSTMARRKDGSGVAAREDGELDENVLDGVSIAGLRFQEMLRTLSGANLPS